MFDNVCSEYKTLCQNYDENAAMYQDYFACSVFQLGNQMGYLGPHCRSDGHTIGIGIYSDENCNSYVGDVADLEQYTAKSFDDSELSPFYENACVSCKSSESYVLRKDGNYANGQEYTYPLCGAAYANSAKCNQHLDSSSDLVSVTGKMIECTVKTTVHTHLLTLTVSLLFTIVPPRGSRNGKCMPVH